MQVTRELYLKANESIHVYKKENGEKIYVFNEQGLYFYLCDNVKSFFDFLRRGEASQIQITGERNLEIYLRKICGSTLLTQGFRTSKGEIIKSSRLIEALNKVANDWKENAYLVRKEDEYAIHVTEEEKEKYLREALEFAESIRRGEQTGFWCWQRINTELTGECVAFLPK